MDDFKPVNAIYAEFFGEHKPARSAVQVARLPLDALFEIEAIVRCVRSSGSGTSLILTLSTIALRKHVQRKANATRRGRGRRQKHFCVLYLRTAIPLLACLSICRRIDAHIATFAATLGAKTCPSLGMCCAGCRFYLTPLILVSLQGYRTLLARGL